MWINKCVAKIYLFDNYTGGWETELQKKYIDILQVWIIIR